MANPAGTGRRWAVLSVVFLTAFVAAFSQFMVAPWGLEVSIALGFEPTQLASVILAPMLVGVFLGLVGGVLGDKYGVKRVVAFGFVISMAAAFLRINASSYGALFLWMFLMGLFVTLMAANTPKLLGSWFPPQQMALAMGIYMSAGALGTAAAQATARAFSTYQAAFLFGAIAICVAFVLWIVVVKDAPADMPPPPPASLGQSLSSAAKSVNVWMLGLGMAMFMGANMTFSSLLPVGLQTGKGVDPAQAGLYASLLTIGVLIGNLGISAVARVAGRMKPVILGCGIFGAVFLIAAWYLAPGVAAMAALLIGGAALGGAPTLIMAGPALLPDIGPARAGAAGGLITTVQMIGAFVLPSWVIAPIGGANYDLVFLLGGLCSALIAVVMLIVPEYGKTPGAAPAAPAEEAA